MTMYWLYDLPSWLFAILVIAFFLFFGLIGLYLTRTHVKRIHKIDHSHNDIVGFFLAALTVFYGITLGLVAIGTWENFSNVTERVDAEAAVVASIYRDVGIYQEPWKTELRKDLSDYLENVINISWPLQQSGVVPTQSGKFLNNFQDHLMSFKPNTMSDEINQAEVFKQYNMLIEMRRNRLNAVNHGLPAPIWALVILGGLFCIITTWFFHTASFEMHIWMVGMTCVLLGLIVFMIGILDNPFRGSVSVTSEPLQLVYEQLISAPAPGDVKPLKQ